MTERDPLAAFFDAGDAPPADPGFRTAVMERVARRRLRLELAARLASGVLLVLAAMVLAPVFEPVAALFGAGLADVIVVLAVTGLVAFAGHYWLTRPVRLPALRIF
jgi:hypothetical protein